VEYWIAGPIIQRSYMRNLKGMIDRSGVTVRLFGSVGAEMLDSLYRQAHIFAMTSIRHSNSIEGYGLSYLEASAHGLPIVAFRTGGVEDAVRDGETGFLLEEGDMDALTRTFEQLVQDAALRKSIGERGVRFVRNLSWHTVVDRLYAKLI
jgi:phosphatidylinositol alpha-1,6-mannosyltransferase